MDLKISIIMAVYNADKYIDRAINSVKNQTYSNWELLLIDDGSTDKSGSICDEYSNGDNRIKTFHKKNGGVSSAREMGVYNSTGDYCIHVDPDDWIEQTMLEKLSSECIAENPDMVIFDFAVERNGIMTIRKQKTSSLESPVILKELFTHIHGSCCNKLIRTKCYRDYDIHFPSDLNYCEDLYVIASLLKNNIKVTYINEAFYHYDTTTNGQSLVKKSHSEIEKDIFLKQKFISLLRGTPALGACIRSMNYTILHHMFISKKYSTFMYIWNSLPYLSGVFSKGKSRKIRFLLFISSIGLYKFALSSYFRHLK